VPQHLSTCLEFNRLCDAQIVGEYHLGEFVNRFRHGSLVMKLADSDVARLPTLLFGTINGVIGVIASVPQAQFAFLSKLQVGHGQLHAVTLDPHVGFQYWLGLQLCVCWLGLCKQECCYFGL